VGDGGIRASGPLGHAVARAQALRSRWQTRAVAVTLGPDGVVAVLGDGAPLSIPVCEPVTAADTCGAGDAFAVAATIALARGAVVSRAIQDAVAAAGEFVERGGAAAIHPRAATRAAVASTIGTHLAGGRSEHTLVATGGCFDILHPGHVHTLAAARRLGDRLVVLINDDASVRRLKGPDRPLQPVEDRKAVLDSIADVDEVVVFSDDTPTEVLRRLRPSIFVKGGDYTATELPETEVLAEWGGTVVTVPFLEGRSTTGLVARARIATG
jgi:rfaE bifunctional protein nucleotidyltransferase chain/domain